MANALQRKTNKADFDTKLSKIEQALMLETTGNGTTMLERLNSLEKKLEDAKTSLDLSFEERLSKKLITVEDELKRMCKRDMQRVDTELLILN